MSEQPKFRMARRLTSAFLAMVMVASMSQAETVAAHPSELRFGLHLSEIAIEGNHVQDVEALFRTLKYKVVRKSWASGWQQLNEFLYKNASDKTRVRKAAYFAHGWTHIIDPELVILTEEKILAKESQLLHAKIVVWLSESASDSYGFWVYDHGRLLRGVLSADGTLKGSGRRLSAEENVNWKGAGEDEILDLAHRLGPGFDAFEGNLHFRLYDLDEQP